MQICAVLGVVISLYALYVEAQHEANEFYVALCDINSWIACSKVGTERRMSLSGVALLTAGTGVRERVRARRRQVCGGDGLASQPAQRVLRYGLRPVVLVSRR